MRHGFHTAAADDAVAEALGQLRDELAVVRQVLDEIRSELQWANRNRGDSLGADADVNGAVAVAHRLTGVDGSAGRVPGSS